MIFWVFAYTLIGTCVNHNDWLFCGEWWYNSVNAFLVGLFFARFEKTIITHIKKHYVLYVVLAFILFIPLFEAGEVAQRIFSYYGENFHADYKVLRRWACLFSQILASCAFVFFVFMMGLKVKIGNKVLNFIRCSFQPD